MRDIMLIVHFLGLVMGLGTSLAHAFLGVATAESFSYSYQVFMP